MRRAAVICAGLVLVGSGFALGVLYTQEDAREGRTDKATESIREHISALKRFEANADTPEQADTYRKMIASAEANAAALSANADDVGAIYVGKVVGAPSDGNDALRIALQSKLAAAGVEVEPEPQACGLTVDGKVDLRTDGDKDDIEILWTVVGSDGSSPGKVSQKNKVPAGSFDQTWGRDAEFVAKGAVDGLRRIIERASINCL